MSLQFIFGNSGSGKSGYLYERVLEEAAKHPDWFYNDGIHLNGAGRSGFADLIRTSLGVEAPTTEE